MPATVSTWSQCVGLLPFPLRNWRQTISVKTLQQCYKERREYLHWYLGVHVKYLKEKTLWFMWYPSHRIHLISSVWLLLFPSRNWRQFQELKAIPVETFKQCYEEWKEYLKQYLAVHGIYLMGKTLWFMWYPSHRIHLISVCVTFTIPIKELKTISVKTFKQCCEEWRKYLHLYLAVRGKNLKGKILWFMWYPRHNVHLISVRVTLLFPSRNWRQFQLKPSSNSTKNGENTLTDI